MVKCLMRSDLSNVLCKIKIRDSTELTVLAFVHKVACLYFTCTQLSKADGTKLKIDAWTNYAYIYISLNIGFSHRESHT